jgi:hypothetical protein
MTTEPGRGKDKAGDPAHDSPKRHGDKLGAAVDKTKAAPSREEDRAGYPAHDSLKRQGDKLEHARDAAAGRKTSD